MTWRMIFERRIRDFEIQVRHETTGNWSGRYTLEISRSLPRSFLGYLRIGALTVHVQRLS